MDTANHKRLIFIIALFVCLFIIDSSAQAEVTYIGEICFEMIPAIPPPPPFPVITQILQLGVLAYGAGHYALNGQIGFPDGVPIYGTAVIDTRGSNPLILISLTSTQMSGDFALYFLRFDGNNQTGNYSINVRRTPTCFGCLPPPEPSFTVISGTFALHACP